MVEMTYLRFLRSVDWSGHMHIRPRSKIACCGTTLCTGAKRKDRIMLELSCLQWFRTGNYREDDHYGLVIPAMDIPSTNDSGNSNNTEGEPEEYPLTFGEVIVIRPADQLHLDLQCDWRPKVVDMYSKGHLEHMVREKLLWWPRQKQAIGPDVASQHDELDEDPGASLNPPQRRVYQTFVGHTESVTT
ncbi:hypothetical protein E4U60_000332 [Claviceps pazoutovae]|uniref:Uncharacterized protein n=1 Tax=Claviceps pazoutovae TaxID=1649127 RepID=A0A9P7SIJ8_9HYPO|nr:hypothetical protein E4U60_000332 [Claviceps pazoutovae]